MCSFRHFEKTTNTFDYITFLLRAKNFRNRTNAYRYDPPGYDYNDQIASASFNGPKVDVTQGFHMIMNKHIKRRRIIVLNGFFNGFRIYVDIMTRVSF